MLQVNGQPMDRTGLHTVQDLLDKQGWKAAQVAVEHNGAILRREDFSTTALSSLKRQRSFCRLLFAGKKEKLCKP